MSANKSPSLGLVAGIVFFILIMLCPAPEGLSPLGLKAAAVAVLMAIWWLSDAIPMGATALLPLILFPVLGIGEIKNYSGSYTHPNIFLFMGGFMIAMSMQKWNLHERIALKIISLVGDGTKRMLAGFMLATFFLSMWISNTATTVMMIPIALAVISQVQDPERRRVFGLVVCLGIAYAANVGGISTPVGTPPNLIFLTQVETLFPERPEISFVEWMSFAAPISISFVLLVWAYLAFWVGRKAGVSTGLGGEVIQSKLSSLGRMSGGEKGVALIALFTALLWIFRRDLNFGVFSIPGWNALLGLPPVHDASVAILGALMLFSFSSSGERLLNWEWAKRIPWEVLLLIGGGLALAEGMKSTGLTEWMAGGLVSLAGSSQTLIVFSVCLFSTFLTEMFSNSPAIAIALPILASSAEVMKIDPYLLMIPATLSVSFAFMMPVATPPNAIAMGGGYIKISDMARAGFVLSVGGAVWITLMTGVLL